jgi:hypothetical protein
MKRMVEMVGIGDTGTLSATLQISPLHTDDVGLLVLGSQAGTQTGNLLELRDSTGAALVCADYTGALYAYSLSPSITNPATVYSTTITATNMRATVFNGTTLTASTFGGAANVFATTVTASIFGGAANVWATTITATQVDPTLVNATQVTATNIGCTTVTGTQVTVTNVNATTVTGTQVTVTNVNATTVTGTTVSTTTMIVGTGTPATSGAAGTTGTIKWDSNKLYVCVATNTWKSAAIDGF